MVGNYPLVATGSFSVRPDEIFFLRGEGHSSATHTLQYSTVLEENGGKRVSKSYL
jgi:hypothetical protein